MDARLYTELQTCAGAINDWYRPPMVANLGLSTIDQALLAEFGVPLKFDPLFVGRESLDRVEFRGQSFIRIASEYAADLVIEPDTRRVLSLVQHERGCRFVNTDLAHFLLFVCRLKPIWSQWSNKADPIVDAEVAELRVALQAIDPEAFRSAAHWWSLVFEQFEAGTL